jgi:hypothetical protein
MAKTYKPTSGMASAARRALKWKSEGKPGGTLVGLARANQLKDRDPLSASTVMRMHSFFSRHEVDKRAEGFFSGEEGFPSKGRVAWDLWGGDGGQSWARQKRDQIVRDRAKKALALVKFVKQKSMIEQGYLDMVAQAVEDYANENIPENVDAFGQFMYHAELLRNGHVDIYLVDLPQVEQPYRDVLVEIVSTLYDYDDDDDEDDMVDDEDSDDDTPEQRQ